MVERGLCDEVREACAEIARTAEFVTVDVEAAARVEPGPAPALDPDRHYLEGSREDVASYLLTLDAINFGSGWFPTLHKRPRSSGYFTVAWALADKFRAGGPWSPAELRSLDGAAVARVLGQDEDHPLMALYGRALRELGEFLRGRSAVDVIDDSGGSSEALATSLARGMTMFDDRGFYKRAQIVPSDLALAGVGEFRDLDRLTIFADNLVPHVLRIDGVLRYDADLAARIDAGELLPPGQQEREIRACAVHACELIGARSSVPQRAIDTWLWNRGQEPKYKAIPRHRTRSIFY